MKKRTAPYLGWFLPWDAGVDDKTDALVTAACAAADGSAVEGGGDWEGVEARRGVEFWLPIVRLLMDPVPTEGLWL